VLKLSQVLSGWAPSERGASREPIALLEAGWAEIVGAEVAKNSRPARIVDGTLVVTTRSSAWSHQLSFLGEHVLRAVAARLPGAEVARLRFRVGTLTERRPVPPSPARASAIARARERPQAASAAEALARFRGEVEDRRRSKVSSGWKECGGCGALFAEGEGFCTTCSIARAQARVAATARLLFEAPWLGYAGTAALVEGLQKWEYERTRAQLLTRWWGTLVRARAAGRLSRNARERLIASSYVVLHSKLRPEEIMPATVRSILGDELHDLLYGDSG
jgi:hypothetical protein